MTTAVSPEPYIRAPKSKQPVPGLVPRGPGLWFTIALLLLTATLLTPFASAQIVPDTTSDPVPTPEPILTETIEASKDKLVADSQIRERLYAILQQFEPLQQVDVMVANGVVNLTGEVDSNDYSVQAEELARRVEGVVAVLNQTSVNLSLGKRLGHSWQAMLDELRGFVSLLPLIIVALLIIAGSGVLARYLSSRQRIYERLSDNWFMRDLWRQVVYFSIIAGGVIAALSLLDATALLGSLVGALGIIGLAIGFATRDTVENYIASILLSLRQPFSRDDAVQINDVQGKVLRLTPRATVLMSFDGNHVRIPNATVFKATIVNYSRNPLRRFDFQVGIDTDLELTGPRELALRTLAAVPGVLKSPAPVCLVEQLGDSSVVLRMQAWIDQRESDYLKARSEAQRLIKEAFDDADIVMPEPIYNVNLRRDRKTTDKEGPAETGKNVQQRKPDTQSSGESPTTDITPDDTVEKQMRAERAEAGGKDLLSESAPQE